MVASRLLRPLHGLLLTFACTCWRQYGTSGPADDWNAHAHNCRAVRLANWLNLNTELVPGRGWVKFH